MAPQKGTLLSTSDFPLYLIKSLGERHFLVGGGGGQAKTGIANAFEIFEIRVSDGKIVASSICRHDLGLQAPMNGAVLYDGRNHVFAAGLDDECHTFSVKYKVVSPKKSEKTDTGTEAVQRKGNKDSDKTDTQSETKYVTFDVHKTDSVKSDFSKDGSFQKCVQFGPDGSILATGGADGHLRVWKQEDMSMLYEVAAHKQEIDDVDICPAGNRIATVARGSSCSIWNTKDGKRFVDIEWPGKTEEYRFRACRFGIIEGNKERFNLYTINIPCQRQTKPSACFISMWDGSTFKPKIIANAGTEVLSSMAVSKDGIYVGVGMITGSVAVYVSFNLTKLYYVKEAHGIFVTGLDFMPVSEAAKAVTGNQDFTLLSISADNTVRMHQEPTRSSYNLLLILFGVAVVIYAVFWGFNALGL